MREKLSPSERRRAGGLAAAVVALHLIGFGTLLLLVVPRHFSLGHAGVFGLGLGMTAYTLGLRHAFDADHIAAIDNTTRKLMADGKRPMGVGFFFSLGHSTVVFVVAVLVALAGPRVIDLGGSGSMIGAGVSGTFLYAIAAVNVAVLIGIVRAFHARDEAALEMHLRSRGLVNRLLGRFAARVRESWHMYPVGLLFGLGFDTASEVALLFLAAGAASTGLPLYAILCLPVLFAAGMSLLDTIDGSFMNFAYGWAFSKPVRKIYYNLTITGLSVAVAFIVGSIELLSIVGIAHVDLSVLGYFIVGLFVVTWALALAVWRIGRIEEKWAADIGSTLRASSPPLHSS